LLPRRRTECVCRPSRSASAGFFLLLSEYSVAHSSLMRATRPTGGNFVVSLDYELIWGVRDHATRETYGPNVLGGRKAIPAILELFQRHGIRATWATVGALLCESKDELLVRAERAAASGARVPHLDDIGPDERRDPYYFGASLARLIASCEGQEIGTHTFSHRHALEPGETVQAFSVDVSTAISQLKEWGITCRSIVFPRNQYGAAQLEACRALGLSHFRGNEASWFYAPAPGRAQTKARRLCRLADSYLDLSGPNVSHPREGNCQLINVASSRFLRPFHRRLAPLESLRFKRIESAMETAALSGGTFHLWWHPENFGANFSENMAILSRVVDAFRRLRDQHGMQSKAMHEIASRPPRCQTPRAA
jgi:peptidoglycan/xylan/chitin deacetylase (PgdA/CDA1 family)